MTCPLADCGREDACRPPAPTCPHPFYKRTALTGPVEFAARERERWADIFDLHVRQWREGPNTPDARIAISVVMDLANRLRFNEPFDPGPDRKGGK